MSTLAIAFDTALAAAIAAVVRIPGDVSTAKAFDESTLLGIQGRLGDLARLIDSRSAVFAGEVAFRSRRELGYQGLAQKEGFRTAEQLIQHSTGSSRRAAATLVTAGTMVHEATIEFVADPVTGEVPIEFVAREPWLAAVGAAVASGVLAIDAATAIREGLGSIALPGIGAAEGCRDDDDSIGVTEAQLTDAVHVLLAEAIGDDGIHRLNADALLRRARELRDELDEAGIAERERIVYEQRAFRRVRRPNGASRFILDGDLETSAWLDDLYDKLTSPRRGGPRFVDPTDAQWANNIATDPRATDQYVHDAVIGILRKGVDTDFAETSERAGASRIVGSRPPSVRVLVTEESLRLRVGHGRIEGTNTPISIGTVERLICTSGTVPIAFGNDGNVINLGRESRLFSSRQKAALAARDGGCLWSDCDRPPSWTEAHHINQWARDHGNTDLADGILLCRHHHLLLHNNGWDIARQDHDYWLVPPPDIDSHQTRRLLTSKSAALRDLQRERECEPQHSHARAG